MEYRKYRRNLKARLVNFFRLLCGIFLAPLKRLLFENQLECYPECAFFASMRRYRNYLEQCARVDHQEDTVGSRGTLFDIEKKRNASQPGFYLLRKCFPG